jgi:phosphoesterase RecJ-like protein
LKSLAEVPAERAKALRTVAERLLGAERVVLTTHVNADGDGVGSQVAVAAWLGRHGVGATVVNPTRFPPTLRFLVERDDLVADLPDPAAEQALAGADLLLVLDTSEPTRLEPLLPHVDPARTIVIDHHPPGPSVVGDAGVQDPTAAATGELIYDLISVAGGDFTAAAVQGIYVALVSDTGSFRFSNTTPRAHVIAAEMLARGVDPETVYPRLFATFPRRRVDLLRSALESLEHDPELGLSWMVVPHDVAERLGATSEDFEGLIDHARSVERTRVALLFREMPDGVTKISFRSNGATDVNRIARDFGGGGHVKAAGATVARPAADAVPLVLQRVREALG